MINATDDPWTIRRTRSNSPDISYSDYRTITCRRKSLGGDNWDIVPAVFYLRRDLTTSGSPISHPRIVNDFVHTVCLRCMKVSYTVKAATDEVAGNALITTIHPACAPDEELGVESGSRETKSIIEDIRGGRTVDGLMPLYMYTSINHLPYTIGTLH
ncbi:hypothetical protein G7Y89_g13536 [Cudoniella acicularis]|uniref:Uncharacterized protein n=1 Tax=Cudoniella acicularis TaxID=354080 RepID=A0A8H4R940_9HELO|nr:hypothetical protein G7Y89_g13536 [Cudoniella acicularis]